MAWFVVFAVVGIALLLLGQLPLALAAWVLAAFALVVRSMRVTSQRYADDVTDTMSAESRTLFAPIRRLTAEIEALVDEHQDRAVMKIVGGEAAMEARRIRDQVAQALQARDELKKALRSRNLAHREVEELRAKVEQADTDATRETLASALSARELELKHYETAEHALQRIDVGVQQAQAALSEMKARLAMKASSEKATLDADEDALRETIGRLKALSISYEEAEQLLRS